MVTVPILVKGLSVSTRKAAPNETPGSIVLDENGVAGDRHAGPGLRQVSVMAEEHALRLLPEGQTEVAAGVNKENILVRGLEGAPIAPMDRIVLGTAVLEVTQVGTYVSDWGKKLCGMHAPCGVTDYGVFCRVLSGGGVATGDAGEYQRRRMRARVITLSDRAAGGKYPDRSGPKIEEMLGEFGGKAGWIMEIDRVLLPDDPEQLRRALEAAKSDAVDVVFTTGGTGIGPRDNTPEVVRAMADKEIPGLMEQVRWKYGQQNPRAWLSRSVACTMGGTLVYALPGSMKAVEEYTSEITQTLEHLLLTLRGLDAH